MISLINLAVLFAAKVADNALSTTKQYWYREVGGYLQALRLSYPTSFILDNEKSCLCE